jgi:hypothetical protein
MKKNLFIPFVILLMIACNSPSNQSSKQDSTINKPQEKTIVEKKETDNQTDKTKPDKEKTEQVNIDNKEKPTVTTSQTLLKGKIVKKGNNIFVHQSFNQQSNEIIGEVHEVNIKKKSLISLSAYTKEIKSGIGLWYRFHNGKQWSKWIKLSEDKHIHNPNRKVFEMSHIYDDIKKIQFKSDTQLNEVVFNIFST